MRRCTRCPRCPSRPTPGRSGRAVASYGSVRLLCDRAAAVRPDFELGKANATAVVRLCRRLDGMPLAIELAAVWLRTLTPAQLAERLDDRFALLTGGSRTALPRHRTLRAVVDWSWDLLSGAEQILARRLAVFPGGAGLAAAEQVCADELLPAAAVLPALSGLVDKSIISAESPAAVGPRYRMLETVRAYGLERLAEAGEAERLRDAFGGLLPRPGRDRRFAAPRRQPGPLAARADGRAGQPAHRAALDHQPRGRGHRPAVRARPVLVLADARAAG